MGDQSGAKAASNPQLEKENAWLREQIKRLAQKTRSLVPSVTAGISAQSQPLALATALTLASAPYADYKERYEIGWRGRENLVLMMLVLLVSDGIVRSVKWKALYIMLWKLG